MAKQDIRRIILRKARRAGNLTIKLLFGGLTVLGFRIMDLHVDPLVQKNPHQPWSHCIFHQDSNPKHIPKHVIQLLTKTCSSPCYVKSLDSAKFKRYKKQMFDTDCKEEHCHEHELKVFRVAKLVGEYTRLRTLFPSLLTKLCCPSQF